MLNKYHKLLLNICSMRRDRIVRIRTRLRAAGSSSPEKVKNFLNVKASRRSLGLTQHFVQAVKQFSSTEGKRKAAEALIL